MHRNRQRSVDEVVCGVFAEGNAMKTYANVTASAVPSSECPTSSNTRQAETQTQSPNYERNYNKNDVSKCCNALKTDAESQTELLVLLEKADMTEFSSQNAPSGQSAALSTKCLQRVSMKETESQTLPLESFEKLHDELASIFQCSPPEYHVKILTREAASEFLLADCLVKDAFESAPKEFLELVYLGSLPGLSANPDEGNYSFQGALPENTDKVVSTQRFSQECLEKTNRKRAGPPKSFGKVHKSAQGSSSRCFVKSHGKTSNGVSPGSFKKPQAKKVASEDSSKVNNVKDNIVKHSSYKHSAHRSYVIPFAKKAAPLNSSSHSNAKVNAKRRTSLGSQPECFGSMRRKKADSQDYPDSFGAMTLTLKGLVLGGFLGTVQIKVKKSI